MLAIAVASVFALGLSKRVSLECLKYNSSIYSGSGSGHCEDMRAYALRSRVGTFGIFFAMGCPLRESGTVSTKEPGLANPRCFGGPGGRKTAGKRMRLLTDRDGRVRLLELAHGDRGIGESEVLYTLEDEGTVATAPIVEAPDHAFPGRAEVALSPRQRQGTA
jgi:hypothetical protein